LLRSWHAIFSTAMIFTLLGTSPKCRPGFRSATQTGVHPWRRSTISSIDAQRGDRHPVLASSALKEAYRAKLLQGMEGMTVIYLKGSDDLIWRRMFVQERHYMKPQMLQSQFDILEEPTEAVALDMEKLVEDMLDTITMNFEKGN
jgi:gluconokinase